MLESQGQQGHTGFGDTQRWQLPKTPSVELHLTTLDMGYVTNEDGNQH